MAIAVSRLGFGAAFVGKLGDDEFGRMLAVILRDNGVDDGGVVFDAGARTALAFVTLRADGEHEFMFYRKSATPAPTCSSLTTSSTSSSSRG
jgi:fructokinase